MAILNSAILLEIKITLFLVEAKTITSIISLHISFLFLTIKAKSALHGHCG